jgi:hypothetical protein
VTDLTLTPEDEINWAFTKMLQNQFQTQDFMRNFEESLYQKKRDELNQADKAFDPQKNIKEIPTFAAQDINKTKFQELLTQETFTPFILRNFLKETTAIQCWSANYLSDIAADTQVSYSIINADNETQPMTHGTIKQALATNDDAATCYIHNTSQIFKEHPSLLDELNFERLKNYFNPLAICAVPHLFLGYARRGIPIPLHAANETNAFMMIEGCKRWTLIDPKYSYALRPKLMNTTLNAFTEIQHDPQDFDYFERHHPLFNRLPKFSSTLKPGDILVLGPWWWHMIDNLTPQTIAVASRWTPRKRNTFARGNIVFNDIQKSNTYFKKYSKHYMRAILQGDIVGDDILNEQFAHNKQYDPYHNPKKKGTL